MKTGSCSPLCWTTGRLSMLGFIRHSIDKNLNTSVTTLKIFPVVSCYCNNSSTFVTFSNRDCSVYAVRLRFQKQTCARKTKSIFFRFAIFTVEAVRNRDKRTWSGTINSNLKLLNHCFGEYSGLVFYLFTVAQHHC